MRLLQKGEYDLANISLLGFDPVTGRSYEECHAEWKRELDSLEKRTKAMRWWDVRERLACSRQGMILRQRLGFG